MLGRSASLLQKSAVGLLTRSWLNKFSSTEAGAGRAPVKSILEAAEPPSSSAAHQALGAASEAYMHRVQQEAALGQNLAAKPSGGKRVVSLLLDALGLSALGAGAFCGYLYYKYDISKLEETLEKAKTEKVEPWSLNAAWMYGLEHYVKIAKDLRNTVKQYADPPVEKLLPDLEPELRGMKTLVLDLQDLLVHKEWTRAVGWKIYKRPGVSDFLLQMAPYYEVVIYTDETFMYASSVIDRLDTYKVVRYRLYRTDTQYHNGKHVRDLSKLNRDLSHIIFVSANPDAWEFQPENTLKLKPWTTETQDTTLLDLVPFLQMVASRNVHDVRDVVKAYDGEEDVVRAFKERVQRIAEHHKATSARGRLAGIFR